MATKETEIYKRLIRAALCPAIKPDRLFKNTNPLSVINNSPKN